MAVIECNDVSIRYKIGDIKAIGLKEYVMRKLTGNFKEQEFWADRNITFSLSKGDMLGIVGTNGAGKSTLLKAISGVMEPTKGSVRTEGKIAALLELASGFDNDLTVKENTFLRGALLGYSRAFMNERYQEIISFAELEEFEDYTFRQLSSGMKSRLAFSIACMVDPDILILDEVLSVGDAGFKDKSAKRMREILNNGVTGVLVSHSLQQIRNLCNKCLWLDHGRQIAFGNYYDVCNSYNLFLFAPRDEKKLPESEEEMAAQSLRYATVAKLAEFERKNPDIVTQTWYRSENETQRVQRLMKKEAQLDEQERKDIQAQIVRPKM